jgi:DNA (cytosine-5)-methyltransferase 1
MPRPLLLDGFCKAGGAGTGYHRAGFDVLGVDIEPQPRYPFPFVQADMLQFLASANLSAVAAIHISPPCQDHMMTPHKLHGTGWMLPAGRDLLLASGLPWVIENVPGAAMRPDYKLCGCMFGLRIPEGQLVRERWFETSWHGFELRPPCHHIGPAISVIGDGTPTWTRQKIGRNVSVADYRALMGISWMNRSEMSQAIPPAYTEHIGRQLLAALEASHA